MKCKSHIKEEIELKSCRKISLFSLAMKPFLVFLLSLSDPLINQLDVIFQLPKVTYLLVLVP